MNVSTQLVPPESLSDIPHIIPEHHSLTSQLTVIINLKNNILYVNKENCDQVNFGQLFATISSAATYCVKKE